MATKYIKIIFKIWMNQNAILHILAYLHMLFWKRLAVCSTIPFHLPGHTTITTFLSLSWNSGRAMQLVLAKQNVAYTPRLCSFTGSPPTDQLMKIVREELSEETQGDGEPQDGRSPGLWVPWLRAAWLETSAMDLTMRTKETCIMLKHKISTLVLAVARISLTQLYSNQNFTLTGIEINCCHIPWANL